MDSEFSGTELTTVFARIHSMLLSRESAATAVEQLAEVAQDVVDSAIGAGASMIDDQGHTMSTGATDAVAEAADTLQYELGEGPCLSAWATEALQRVDDTATETRWRRWCAEVLPLGVRSAMSAPMLYKGRCIGALKVYTTTADGFTAADERRLSLLAAAAATLLGAAQTSEAPRKLSEALRTALSDRQMVDVATGIVMERRGLGQQQARVALLEASRAQGRELTEIARAVLDRSPDATF
ncbi:GAF and ANTAR domain-containing protein [Kocuria rosea]|jgi:GAF domain-containing protein|uniref:GAF and ANTAR domain-containing protein n=1 Tax=Kocuria rosea TaxID=1275 RepID=UPI00203F5FDF|nr:GAF and ANTAR domain-containing protein [Kocuria rosea]MCM3687315.1 GAF and ANTAR domain-containing protein [Kocuria rosea]HST71084.1 GAF and ANTAR domain-containing protein [Kocuria rosea]